MFNEVLTQLRSEFWVHTHTRCHHFTHNALKISFYQKLPIINSIEEQ